MTSPRTRIIFSLGLLLAFSPVTRAQWDDGYWFLEFDSGTSSTVPPLRVGVDLGDGSGFSLQTIPDHNADGVIHLPRVPVGGRLALGVQHAGGEVGCDIWDIIGTQVVVGTMIQKPLLIIAEDIEATTLGVDYGDFTEPPFALTPGALYTVVDGSVAAWPEVRFVNDFGVPGLEEFVQLVDSLPNFSGDVRVSTATLTGTFVPEPGAAGLLLLAAAWIGAMWRCRRCSVRPGRAWRVALVAVILVAAPRGVNAESFTWILPGDGIWDTATNWTPFQPLPPNPIVGPPDTGDAAIIQTPYRVTLQDDYLALTGLLIANGASVNTNFNGLSVVVPDDGGVVTITGEGSKLIVRNVAGNVNAFFFDQLNLSNGGELDIEGTVARIFATGGAGVGGLDVDADSRITGRGELYVSSHIAGSEFNNRGTIRPDVNQTIAITAPVGNPSIDLDGSGPNLNSHLDLSNAGATLIVEPALTDAFGGRITMGDDSTLTIDHSWTLAGTFNQTSRIDFDPGDGNSAHVSGSLLSVGGQSFHGNLQALSGVGNVDAPIELHSNANVSVLEDANISFNGPTTIHGGMFNTHSILLADGDVDFNGPTTYSGNVTINGIAQQQGNATVSAMSVVTADAFDMDGSSGNTIWDINAPLTVNAERIDSGVSSFNGTFDIGGPTSAWMEVNLTDPQASWEMAGTANLSGVSIGFVDRVRGSPMEVTGALNVQQRVGISADTTLATGSTTDIDAASHRLRMSGVTVVEPGATITGEGTLQNAASGNMLLPIGLSTGNVGLVNEGYLRLGDAVGVVAVEEFAQTAGATLVVDVGKSKVGTDSDVLTTGSGAAGVDGFIQPNIAAIGGTFVAPIVGDSFTILTAVGGVSGTFDDVLNSNLGGMIYEWNAIHNPANVVIQVAGIGGLLGDYNGDGFVNVADYVVWRNTLGSTMILAADGSMNGTIDQDDYDVWVANFGATLGSGAGELAAVPEPSGFVWIAIASCLAARFWGAIVKRRSCDDPRNGSPSQTISKE